MLLLKWLALSVAVRALSFCQEIALQRCFQCCQVVAQFCYPAFWSDLHFLIVISIKRGQGCVTLHLMLPEFKAEQNLIDLHPICSEDVCNHLEECWAEVHLLLSVKKGKLTHSPNYQSKQDRENKRHSTPSGTWEVPQTWGWSTLEIQKSFRSSWGPPLYSRQWSKWSLFERLGWPKSRLCFFGKMTLVVLSCL